MATRTAQARWEGDLKGGKGTFKLGEGAISGSYSFASRFEEGAGSNPEELIGGAHASCFAMAFSLALGEAGYKPESIDVTAAVSVEPHDGGFKITKSHLTCVAKVPGLEQSAFQELAKAAKEHCPVSVALAGVEITLDAKLA